MVQYVRKHSRYRPTARIIFAMGYAEEFCSACNMRDLDQRNYGQDIMDDTSLVRSQAASLLRSSNGFMFTVRQLCPVLWM